MKSTTADQAFCDGLNWICFHTFSHRPSLADVPGLTHSAGDALRPHHHLVGAVAALRHLPRALLADAQPGDSFCADVLFYQGDGIRMTYEPGKPIPRLGVEDGLKNPPPSLGAGYDYDKCNTDVLLTRLSVKDGKLALTRWHELPRAGAAGKGAAFHAGATQNRRIG